MNSNSRIYDSHVPSSSSLSGVGNNDKTISTKTIMVPTKKNFVQLFFSSSNNEKLTTMAMDDDDDKKKFPSHLFGSCTTYLWFFILVDYNDLSSFRLVFALFVFVCVCVEFSSMLYGSIFFVHVGVFHHNCEFDANTMNVNGP